MVWLVIEVVLNLFVLVINAAVMLLRWLPSILAFLRNLVQWALVISVDIYRAILTWLAPLAQRVRINLVANPWRSVACVLLSLMIGVIIMLLAGWNITPPGLGGCAAHGLIVGVVWDQLGPPSGVRFGV
jgi:hypothetical protein